MHSLCIPWVKRCCADSSRNLTTKIHQNRNKIDQQLGCRLADASHASNQEEPNNGISVSCCDLSHAQCGHTELSTT